MRENAGSISLPVVAAFGALGVALQDPGRLGRPRRLRLALAA
jgi:hypothetical protein